MLVFATLSGIVWCKVAIVHAPLGIPDLIRTCDLPRSTLRQSRPYTTKHIHKCSIVR